MQKKLLIIAAAMLIGMGVQAYAATNTVTELSCTTDYVVTYTATATFDGTPYTDTTPL